MKRFLVLFLLVACLLVGCSNSKQEVISDIQKNLNQNDEQVLVALGDCLEAKEDLIQSTELNSDGLMALCTNPEPLNRNNRKVQEWFRVAIERVELTEKQEAQIAKIGELVYTIALLEKKGLTGEGLVAVCKNPGNLNMDNNKEIFKKAIGRTNLTVEQRDQIAKSKVGGIGLV